MCIDAKDNGGNLGVRVRKAPRQDLQIPDDACTSPTPTQIGRVSPGGRWNSVHLTRRVCRSHLESDKKGCCTDDACNSSNGMQGMTA